MRGYKRPQKKRTLEGLAYKKYEGTEGRGEGSAWFNFLCLNWDARRVYPINGRAACWDRARRKYNVRE